MLPGAGGRGEDSNKAGYYLRKSTRVAEPAGKTSSIGGGEHRAGLWRRSANPACIWVLLNTGSEHQLRLRLGSGEQVGGFYSAAYSAARFYLLCQ